MTNKAYIPATDAWTVQVTRVLAGVGAPPRELYYSAFPIPDDAVEAVRAYCGAGVHDLVEAKEKVNATAVAWLADHHKLSAGSVIPWAEIP
jgi:hypothetical protein